jgi:excisionase family DNA binding protein
MCYGSGKREEWLVVAELLPVARVAAHLGVSRKRVYQLIEAGRLESLRLGPRGLRVPRASVEQYLKSMLEKQKRDLGLDLEAPGGKYVYRRAR